MAKVKFDIERCKSCELCTTVCPKKIIRISKDELNTKGFHPAEVIDCNECIGCGFCATICPDAVIEIE